MSEISDTISVTTVNANAGNIKAINSDSITNANVVTTSTLTVNENAQVGGNVGINGALEVKQLIRALGGISFGSVGHISPEEEMTVEKDFHVEGDAIFSFNSIIAHEKFGTKDEGIISAQNIRATNRLMVGDSALQFNAAQRTLMGDTFTATLARVITDRSDVANLNFETGRGVTLQVPEAEFDRAVITEAIIKQLKVEQFSAASEFYTKDLGIDGSAMISGGVTINGSGRNEGALVVNGNTAIFNNGVKVYSKEGVLAQTLTIIGTSDTTGTTDAEREADKTAFMTAPGVRSLFQGDVIVQDSKAIFDNNPIFAEDLTITNLATTNKDITSLQLCKLNYNWDAFVDEQISYVDIVGPEDETEIRTVEQIEARGNQEYVGRAVDKTSKKEAKKQDSPFSGIAELVKKRRDASAASLARAFQIKSVGAKFRLDAAGNVLSKNIVSENIRASKIVANELVANKFQVANLTMDNVSVTGVVNACSGMAVAGTSEVNGKVYNYAEVINKDEAVVVFKDQSQQQFKTGSTLKVENGASLITDDDASVALHGEVEIDMARLILFDSRTGKRYHFILRDATEAERDEAGEVAMEFGEITEPEEPIVATTMASAARSRRQLSDDLEAFQARLKRI